MAWVGEARVPGGNGQDSGEWTDDDDADNVIDVSHNLCANKNAVGFVRQHQQEAAGVAANYSIPTYYVLGLAARESGYGKKGTFTQHNGFFSMQKLFPREQSPTKSDYANIPYATGMVPAGEPNNKTGIRAWVYTYSSFTDSAKSFLESYGSDVRGSRSPEDFLQRLQDSGFNSSSAFLDAEVLHEVAVRMTCPN